MWITQQLCLFAQDTELDRRHAVFPLPEDLQEENGSWGRKSGDSSLSRYRQLMITGRG